MNFEQLIQQGKAGDHIIYKDYRGWYSGIIEGIDKARDMVDITLTDSRAPMPNRVLFGDYTEQAYVVPEKFFTERMSDDEIKRLVGSSTPKELGIYPRFDYAEEIINSLGQLRKYYNPKVSVEQVREKVLSEQEERERLERLLEGVAGIDKFPFSPEERRVFERLRSRIETGYFPS